MRSARTLTVSMALTALLACGQEAKETVVVKEETPVVLQTSPKVVASTSPTVQPTLLVPTSPPVQRHQICVDAPATPLTPEIRAEQHRWVERTIRMSRASHRSAIIIDKKEYTLHLYEDGKRTRSYPVQLGLDPVYDKVMEDDCRTPEGVYTLDWKKRPPKASYIHLHMDYPNLHDYAQFIDLRHRTRQVPLTAEIGFALYIHGGGESGRGDSKEGWNWTKGCVALSDENIQDLDRRVHIGTPITIVRTLK